MNHNESISLNQTAETLMGRLTGSYNNISGEGSNYAGSNSSAPTSVLVPSNALGACHNCSGLTRLLNEVLLHLSANLSNCGGSEGVASTSAGKSPKADESQRNAVVYIVVVLFFYSFGIGLMMIKYMRKEAKEQEECKMYRRYINAAHEQYLNSTNRARLANRLALQALNTVNAIPQTTQLGSKVTFV